MNEPSASGAPSPSPAGNRTDLRARVATKRRPANTPGPVTFTATATADGITVSSSVAVTVTDSTRVRLYPTEDSYVQSTTASTNYGSSAAMLFKPTYSGSPDRLAYLKFDLSQLAGRTVTSAVLSARTAITDGPLTVARADLHAVTSAWSESTVTYANKPTMGATVGSMRVSTTTEYTSADLTTYVAGLTAASTPLLSLGMTQDGVTTDAVIVLVSARESNARPYLDITLAPTAAPASVPPSRIGSVAFTNLATTMEKGTTVAAGTTVKDSTGGAFTGSVRSFVYGASA